MIWEHRRKDPQTLWYESSDPAAGLTVNPHAFLCAAAAPALSRGQRRILLDGAISPRLRDGLSTVFTTLIRWQRPNRRAPEIETTRGIHPTVPAPGAGAAMMLSGGLDSLALFRSNQLAFPAGHSRSYATAFFVQGLDLGEEQWMHDLYRRAFESLRAVAADAGVRLVPIRTNVKDLGSRWAQEHQSGAMASIGHACAGSTRSLDVASSYTWDTLFPYGSHPSLDVHFSSDDMVVRHEDVCRGRLEKMRMLAEWPVGLAALRTCWEGRPPEGYLNCGTCHKCILTLLELIAAGCAEDTPAFPVADVTPELAARLKASQRSSIPFFSELIEPLEARGRSDLADVLRRKLEAIDAHLERDGRGPWWKRVLPRRGA